MRFYFFKPQASFLIKFAVFARPASSTAHSLLLPSLTFSYLTRLAGESVAGVTFGVGFITFDMCRVLFAAFCLTHHGTWLVTCYA